MDRNISMLKDLDGNNIVFIHDVLFKGRQDIKWDDVEDYIKKYVGEIIEIAETGDIVHIASDLPDEYSGSKYTRKLKGTLAKAKANAAQGIPEMIEIATNPKQRENLTQKHMYNAKLGWYYYDTRFALPVYGEDGNIERYNVFYAQLLIRHAADHKLYLYDIINIKKEAGNLF